MINVTQTYLPPIEEYVAYLQPLWETKWITNRGQLVRELEERLMAYLGTANLLAVSNGTVALQIAIKAMGITGDVITTPFSYVATVSSLIWENCNPVFVDIHEDFLTIDEAKLEEALTDQTQAILATHVYGNPCNVEEIARFAERHGLRVIYDAAHCFGVRYQGKSILAWGDASTLSFHATKLFHTGEGGAIVSHDEELARKIFFHHNFGHRGEEAFWGVGINGKLSEINAAMGLAVLNHVEEILGQRKSLCEMYDQLLRFHNSKPLQIRPGTDWNFSYYPLIFESEASLLKSKEALNRADIFPRRYFYPSLNRLPYLKYERMPIAEDISSRVLCLPLHAGLGESEIERICKILIDNG